MHKHGITCSCGDLQDLGIHAPHESLVHQLHEEMEASGKIDQMLLVTLWQQFEEEMKKTFDASLGLTALATVQSLLQA